MFDYIHRKRLLKSWLSGASLRSRWIARWSWWYCRCRGSCFLPYSILLFCSKDYFLV